MKKHNIKNIIGFGFFEILFTAACYLRMSSSFKKGYAPLFTAIAVIILNLVAIFLGRFKKNEKNKSYLPLLIITAVFLILLFWFISPHMLQEETLLEY